MTMEPTGKDLERASDLAFLAPMMPYLKVELDKQLENIIGQACSDLNTGELTGEKAIAYIARMQAVVFIGKTFRTKVAIASGKA